MPRGWDTESGTTVPAFPLTGALTGVRARRSPISRQRHDLVGGQPHVSGPPHPLHQWADVGHTALNLPKHEQPVDLLELHRRPRRQTELLAESLGDLHLSRRRHPHDRIIGVRPTRPPVNPRFRTDDPSTTEQRFRWRAVGRHDPDEYTRLRQLLSRHPALVEATRLAAAVTSRPAEIAVFQRSWAYIVAASSGHVLQPRRLTASEWDLLNDPPDNDTYADENTTSFPILDPHGEVVASLTVQSLADGNNHGVLSSLARLVTGVIATQGCDRGDPTVPADPASPAFPASSTEAPAGVDVTALPDALRDAVVVLDATLDVVWANDAVGSLFGRSRFDVIGRNAADLVHPDDLPVALDAMARLTEGLRLYRVFVRISHGDGDWAPVEITGTDQSANPRIGGIVISLRSAELDEELQIEHAVNHHISETLVEQLHDGMVATDAVGSISVVNHAAYELFGLDPITPPGRLTWRDFPLLDSHGKPVAREAHPLRVMFGVHFEGPTEMSILSPRGEHHYVSVAQKTVTDEDGTLLGSFVTFHDVTEAREAQQELVTQALHDQLTGLPNRRMLTERLEELAVGPHERGNLVAACFVDLDVFKLINDTHGHRTGDHIIRIAAERLSRRL
ncbi:MAG TPA: PAS domain-containing protein, partial [Acidimicrobiales bacterium]|nr:PAS domain-containing protein [Acidimicrobiales bacterium]